MGRVLPRRVVRFAAMSDCDKFFPMELLLINAPLPFRAIASGSAQVGSFRISSLSARIRSEYFLLRARRIAR